MTPAALESLARTATPGPWKSGWDNPLYDHTGEDAVNAAIIYTTAPGVGGDDVQVVSGTWYDGPITGMTRENAAYVVAVNPAVVLALLARLHAAETALATCAVPLETLYGTELDSRWMNRNLKASIVVAVDAIRAVIAAAGTPGEATP